jgi:quercetin dioxygenase-like cupin family protein
VPAPPKLIHLDELEAVPGPGTLKWLPVRHSLGVRAFGCNAYRADDAGTDVVEPHTEESHEELYFVASGRATFTIDGQTYNAPAGTYVFLPDPASHRHATADEQGTVVLSFGGPPTFEPSAWEWAFRAAARQRTDPEGAVEILQDGLRVKPADAILDYGMACVEALRGHSAAALDWLARAVEVRPEAREWAREDSDLDSLRGDERFSSLVAD